MIKQLRIATLGLFTTWFSYFLGGTIQGSILNGHLHYSINLRQRPAEISAQLDYFKPHIVFCHAIFSEHLTEQLGGETIKREQYHEMLGASKRKWGFKVAYQEGDAKKEPRFPYPIDSIVDLGLINNGIFKLYEGYLKVPCIHWPYFALNQDAPVDYIDNRYKHQLVFTGNTSERRAGHLHHGRAEFLDKLNKRIPIKLFPDSVSGNTRFCSQEIARGCSGVIGISQGLDVPGYVDTRPFQYIGAGGLFFIDSCSSLDLFFEPHVHYVPYNRFDVDDFVEKYNYYMDQRDLNKKIRETGFEYVQKWHSAKRRVQQVIDIFEGKEIKYPIYLEDIRHEI